MAVKTTLEQLEAVQSAIEKVELGQSVSMGGKMLTRADLKVLYDREDRLLGRYNQGRGQGLTSNIGGMRRD